VKSNLRALVPISDQSRIASSIPASNGRGTTPNNEVISCVENSGFSLKRRNTSGLGAFTPIRRKISSSVMAGEIGIVTNTRLKPSVFAQAAAMSRQVIAGPATANAVGASQTFWTALKMHSTKSST